MKKLFLFVFTLSLLSAPSDRVYAQTTTTTTETTYKFSDMPRWVKDMRRFDIITFGAFPFSMFFVTFATDMIRWKRENDFDTSAEGRRYAPWPLKAPGAPERTDEERRKTIFISAGVSAGIALVDLSIVLIRRSIERRRLERKLTGSFEIITSPYGEIEPEDFGKTGDVDIDETAEPAKE